ncbi:uncharacterized protein Triagg1_6429 [Trichoderma aggressivum f. europaeum]|uniref:Uncharacterized protein n=1 Tax=Trichoderma aggressivum f. europaeum TaxID=173218 RepID=A0AAE1IB18_9HYPO|nr:hypothetical protein Triagg1_6429 [Trichoderma aggressivum f. europaeum]
MQEQDEADGKSREAFLIRTYLPSSIIEKKNSKENKKSHAPAITCTRHDSPVRSSNHAHSLLPPYPILSYPIDTQLSLALQANPCPCPPSSISSIFPPPPHQLLLVPPSFAFAATTPSAAMSGSDVDAANTHKEASAPPSSSGSGVSIKKRKKDGLKPIITMEGPPSQRPADADAASGAGKPSKSQDVDMHE